MSASADTLILDRLRRYADRALKVRQLAALLAADAERAVTATLALLGRARGFPRLWPQSPRLSGRIGRWVTLGVLSGSLLTLGLGMSMVDNRAALSEGLAMLMPAARADIGTSEWLVMPGDVFISSRKGFRSLARIIRSARPQPRQPRAR